MTVHHKITQLSLNTNENASRRYKLCVSWGHMVHYLQSSILILKEEGNGAIVCVLTTAKLGCLDFCDGWVVQQSQSGTIRCGPFTNLAMSSNKKLRVLSWKGKCGSMLYTLFPLNHTHWHAHITPSTTPTSSSSACPIASSICTAVWIHMSKKGVTVSSNSFTSSG